MVVTRAPHVASCVRSSQLDALARALAGVGIREQRVKSAESSGTEFL